MITAELIRDKIGAYAQENGLEIVDIRITKFDEITLTIDVKADGKQVRRNVSLDDCVLINRKFTEVFDQDEEDYSLIVTSPGVKGDVEIPDLDEIPDPDDSEESPAEA